MINLISESNIENIRAATIEILALIKAKKFNFISKYREDVRVRASCTLLELSRSFKADYKFLSITSDDQAALAKLELLVANLCSFLENKTQNMCAKLKDYSNDIKPKLCRELVSELEDLLIMGSINRDDIKDVYYSMGKVLPKKYKSEILSDEAQEVFRVISRSIMDKAQTIKANSIQHYIDMINRIDPNDEITDKKEFVKACREKVSDIGTLMLCVACKFASDKFNDLINTEFDELIVLAASKISGRYRGSNALPKVEVTNIHLGAKGFDLIIKLDEQIINARAIPVEGYYVRFHYRYIMT